MRPKLSDEIPLQLNWFTGGDGCDVAQYSSTVCYSTWSPRSMHCNQSCLHVRVSEIDFAIKIQELRQASIAVDILGHYAPCTV